MAPMGGGGGGSSGAVDWPAYIKNLHTSVLAGINFSGQSDDFGLGIADSAIITGDFSVTDSLGGSGDVYDISAPYAPSWENQLRYNRNNVTADVYEARQINPWDVSFNPEAVAVDPDAYIASIVARVT